MLRVMLINDGEGRVVALRKVLAEAGVDVVAEAEPSHDLADAIRRVQPDLVLIDTDAPGRDMLEDVCVASEHTARPVVMFTGESRRETIRAALTAGVAAYVVGEVPASRIQSVLEVAMERFEVDRARREELSETRRRLADRQWIDRAKGVVARMRGVSEDEAYKLLRDRAMQTQKRLGDVAREMVELADWLKP